MINSRTRSMREIREQAELFNRGVVRNWSEYDALHPFVRSSVSYPGSHSVLQSREQAAQWGADLYQSAPANQHQSSHPKDFRDIDTVEYIKRQG